MKIYLGRDVYDVDLIGVTDKQALVWNAAAGKFKPSNDIPHATNADTLGGLAPATGGTNAHLVSTNSSGNTGINAIYSDYHLLADGRSIVTNGTWATRAGSFQSIPNATITDVIFTTQIGPANGNGAVDWDGGTAFYCRQTGFHLAFGSFEFNNVSGRVRCWVRVQGSRYYGSNSAYVGSANVGGVGISAICWMNANEYVQFEVFQESGGNRDLRYSDGSTNFHLCMGGLLRL